MHEDLREEGEEIIILNEEEIKDYHPNGGEDVEEVEVISIFDAEIKYPLETIKSAITKYLYRENFISKRHSRHSKFYEFTDINI